MKNLLEQVLNTYLKTHTKIKAMSQWHTKAKYQKYWKHQWDSRQVFIRVLDADLTMHSSEKTFDNEVHRIHFYNLIILDDNTSDLHMTAPYLGHGYHLAIVVPVYVLACGHGVVSNYVRKKQAQFNQQVLAMQITPDLYTIW